MARNVNAMAIREYRLVESSHERLCEGIAPTPRPYFVCLSYLAKGGIIAFTQALAGAYSPKGIRANAVCPGVILT